MISTPTFYVTDTVFDQPSMKSSRQSLHSKLSPFQKSQAPPAGFDARSPSPPICSMLRLALRLISKTFMLLQEEVGDALMDFAEAAELAELEDAQEEETNRWQSGSSQQKARLTQLEPLTVSQDSGDDLTCQRTQEPDIRTNGQEGSHQLASANVPAKSWL